MTMITIYLFENSPNDRNKNKKIVYTNDLLLVHFSVPPMPVMHSIRINGKRLHSIRYITIHY